jgi:cellulose synthase/poly-beta-1,6-N-acetylglucosamine synthase-like glycosyltransferase
MGIYCVPVLIYSILYKNMKPAVELAKDAFSFVFYSPTYFIIINIYALCRIDDISWGTKGLDSGNVKISHLQ